MEVRRYGEAAAVEIIYETHSISTDNEALLLGERLEDLVDAPFDWRPDWRFRLPADGPPCC